MTAFHRLSRREREQIVSAVLQRLGTASSGVIAHQVPCTTELAYRTLQGLAKGPDVLLKVPGGRGRAAIWEWTGAPDPLAQLEASFAAPVADTSTIDRLRRELEIERETCRQLHEVIHHQNEAAKHTSEVVRILVGIGQRRRELEADPWGPLGH